MFPTNNNFSYIQKIIFEAQFISVKNGFFLLLFGICFIIHLIEINDNCNLTTFCIYKHTVGSNACENIKIKTKKKTTFMLMDINKA